MKLKHFFLACPLLMTLTSCNPLGDDETSTTFLQPTPAASPSPTVPATTTLTIDSPQLLLTISGRARILTVTNSGSAAATNIALTHTVSWPTGTTSSTTCGATLAPSATCTLTITPGANSTADNTPVDVSLEADNSNAVTANVYVIKFGSIFQRGYVFDIDDSSTTGNISGKVASLTDNSTSLIWDGGAGTIGAATSITDGAANTAAAVAANGGTNSYAPGLCEFFEVDSNGNTPCTGGTCYNNWYLPAICELGYDSGGGPACPAMNNIYDNLSVSMTGNYWSSTNSGGDSWVQDFTAASAQNLADFTLPMKVRCVKPF